MGGAQRGLVGSQSGGTFGEKKEEEKENRKKRKREGMTDKTVKVFVFCDSVAQKVRGQTP